MKILRPQLGLNLFSAVNNNLSCSISQDMVLLHHVVEVELPDDPPNEKTTTVMIQLAFQQQWELWCAIFSYLGFSIQKTLYVILSPSSDDPLWDTITPLIKGLFRIH